MISPKRSVTNHNFVRYEHFAKAYLLMAKLALLVRSKSILDLGLTQPDYDRLYNGAILLPTIFCIRQSIELFFKGIDVGMTTEFSKTHNLVLLSDILEKIFCAQEIKEEIMTLTLKYFNYEFTPALVERKLYSKADFLNEVFRYPDHDLGVNIIGQHLPLIDSNLLLQDLKQIEVLFKKLSIAWQVQQQI